MGQERPVILGLAGGSSSGKTLVARRVIEDLGSSEVVMVDQDSYYKEAGHLSEEERAAINYDHPEAFDRELFLSLLDEVISAARTELDTDTLVFNASSLRIRELPRMHRVRVGASDRDAVAALGVRVGDLIVPIVPSAPAVKTSSRSLIKMATDN